MSFLKHIVLRKQFNWMIECKAIITNNYIILATTKIRGWMK